MTQVWLYVRLRTHSLTIMWRHWILIDLSVTCLLVKMFSFHAFVLSASPIPSTRAHTHTHTLTGEAFDYLDGPLLRVTGADVPMPYASSLEKLALPQAENIVNTACRLLNIA